MKIRFTAEGFDISTELDKYAGRKVAQMARHVPRKAKAEADCEIHFTQSEHAGVKHSTCVVTFKIGEQELKAEETTQHMYAALDIAAVRIEQQLESYVKHQKKPGMRSRLKRSGNAE
jgi:ribosomal subunit interface protein